MITHGVIKDLRKQFQGSLDALRELFLKWNQRINLSAARNASDVDEHITDSLHVVPFLVGAGSRVLDVGSGGGFPVVIAAICRPEIEFVSLEPVHKKHAFLRTSARELQLPNLEAHADRLEQHPIADYDVAMSRATFDLLEWLTQGSARVKPGGLVIGFEAVHRPDVIDVERHPYTIAGKARSLVVKRC